MRGPRYRFPNEVRSTARAIASRMVQDDRIVETPEQLEEWISREGDVRKPLEAGGYGTEFTAHDLFPLLQVFITQAEGPAPVVGPAARKSPRWLLGMGVALCLVLAVTAIAILW